MAMFNSYNMLDYQLKYVNVYGWYHVAEFTNQRSHHWSLPRNGVKAKQDLARGKGTMQGRPGASSDLDFWVKSWIYPLANIQKAMENGYL